MGKSPFDGGVPGNETWGVRWFPRGDVFASLIADPKGFDSFLSYFHGTSTSAFNTDVGAVGIGDRLGIFRCNGPKVGEGVQLSLTGNVYAQFDLDKESYDLINADYVIALPLTYRRDWFSSRVRLYHQSSHLGDEFVLESPAARENFGFEAVEALVSADHGPLRLYGGGDYLFNRRPATLEKGVLHAGAEFKQIGALAPNGVLGNIGLVAAVDMKSVEELSWSVAWSARAGFEIGRSPGVEHLSRRWSLLGEYYDGPSPYGQFFRDEVKYYGLGIHLGP